MYFISRAFKYLKKKMGKTLLMAAIFLVIANFVLAGLLIRQASVNAQEQTRLSIGADIAYIPNYDALIEDIEKGIISREELGKLKGRDGLFRSAAMTEKGAPTYQNIMKANESQYVDHVQMSLMFEVSSAQVIQYQVEQEGINTSTFNVKLYVNELPDSFREGKDVLVDGRMITNEELKSGSQVMMIEENLAAVNNLKVSDVVELNYQTAQGDSIRLNHEIVGIYSSTEEISQWLIQEGYAAGFPQNRILVPFGMLDKIGYDADEIPHIMIEDSIIRLKDPENLELFREEMEAEMDMSYGTLDANDALYNSLVGPIEVIGMIANVAVTIILVTGGVIIGLITALTVNERKGEIGILLAVGETKAKIVAQFVLEVLAIAVVTFALSIFTGGVIGDQISDSALASEFLQSEQFTPEYEPKSKGMGKNVVKEMPKEVAMDMALSSDVLLALFGMGITLSVVSTVIPALYVMRFNPKQILNNRLS